MDLLFLFLTTKYFARELNSKFLYRDFENDILVECFEVTIIAKSIFS